MKPGRQTGSAHRQLGKIANTRMTSGVRETNHFVFTDSNGNRIPNSEVYREVEEGWKHFWSKRGGVPGKKHRDFLYGKKAVEKGARNSEK